MSALFESGANHARNDPAGLSPGRVAVSNGSVGWNGRLTDFSGQCHEHTGRSEELVAAQVADGLDTHAG